MLPTYHKFTYIARDHGIAVENYLDDFMGAEVWEKAGLLPAFGFCHCWVWCSWSPGQSLSSNLCCHLSETCPSPLLLDINLSNDLDIGFDIFKFKFWNICNRLIDLKQKGYELIIWCLPCVTLIIDFIQELGLWFSSSNFEMISIFHMSRVGGCNPLGDIRTAFLPWPSV